MLTILVQKIALHVGRVMCPAQRVPYFARRVLTALFNRISDHHRA